MQTNVGHFCINVADLERSVTFYEEVMGLKLDQRIQIPNVNEAILVGQDGSSGIQLAEHLDRTGVIDHGNAFWKLYIHTDDCEGLFRKAIEAGSTSNGAPQRLEQWPVTIAFITDPDGYEIEIVQSHSE